MALVVAGVFFWARAQNAVPPSAGTSVGGAPTASMVPAISDDTVPSYFASAEAAQPYPETLPPSQFPIPVIAHAYAVAKEMPGVLAQQPCYCFCSRTDGHRGLIDCYADLHGASCSVCVQEALLTEKLTREGRTPAEIRAAIIRGDWRNVELN